MSWRDDTDAMTSSCAGITDYPTIHLKPGHSRRLRGGHPWLFSNEIVMDADRLSLPAGTLAIAVDAGGERLGLGSFNPHSLIAMRLFARDPGTVIDQTFLEARLRRALRLRETLFARPFYRLVHAEADGLPGLIVDRYDDVLAVQANTAGIDRLLPDILAALIQILAPRAVLLKNDSPVRRLEGLELTQRMALGELDGPLALEENGVRFWADLTDGQKTGWFYDQRENRAAVAALAAGRRVADFYCYAGGFAVQAKMAGATQVLAIDRSEASLALANRAAASNEVQIETVRAESFAEMETMATAQEKFGVVVADPPAFVKSKKDLIAGAKGYRKMTKLAASLVEEEGFLMVASCSHHMTVEAFAQEVRLGLSAAGRSGRILRAAGAGADHPVHPFLPESAYLKALLLQLD